MSRRVVAQAGGRLGSFPTNLTVTTGDRHHLPAASDPVYSIGAPAGASSPPDLWHWQQQQGQVQEQRQQEQQGQGQGGRAPQRHPSPHHMSPHHVSPVPRYLGGEGASRGMPPPPQPPQCGASPAAAGSTLAENAAADLQAMARSWAADK